MARLESGIEIERKYIIRMPDISRMKGMEGYERSSIVQTYIGSRPGVTHRVRRRTYKDKTVYYETRKTRLDSMSVIEEEGEISESEYERLTALVLDGTVPIIKERHTFVYKNQVFEVDIYPNWGNTAVMETELTSREDDPEIPDFIEIIKEVTGDKRYSNASMSRSFPEELL